MSGGRSKCKRGFCRHGLLAVCAETWQGDGDPPRKVNSYVWALYSQPQVQRALKCGPNGAFLGKHHKTRVNGRFGGGGRGSGQIWMLQWALVLQQAETIKGVMEFEVGVENAPTNMGTPASFLYKKIPGATQPTMRLAAM